MIAITGSNGMGFSLKLSWPGSGWRPSRVKAHNVAEIHEIIDHYHGAPGHLGERENCPLCRAMPHEEETRAERLSVA